MEWHAIIPKKLKKQLNSGTIKDQGLQLFFFIKNKNLYQAKDSCKDIELQGQDP
jgi:hypothetical protein